MEPLEAPVHTVGLLNGCGNPTHVRGVQVEYLLEGEVGILPFIFSLPVGS